MKNSLLLLSLILMDIFAFAQAPQAFKYQAVARDLTGNPVINQEISVKISILAGSPEGTVVYSELHQTTTNSMGLFGLEIGNPAQVLSGNFAEISWGTAAHFLETAIDLSGGGSFQVLGVSQFLSVPYSTYSDKSGFSTLANGIRTMTEQERDALENPPVGMQIYNSSSNCLNYFNGAAWFETCGQCTPLPTQAHAGEDQYFAGAALSTTLQGNIPVHGVGTWTIVTGNGGSFANTNDPHTLFTGQQCESYSLIWTITTPCGSSSDTVSITFFITPTTANAGEDQTNVQATWTTLAANTPLFGQGQWIIIQGNGGQLVTPSSPSSLFLGQANTFYLLEWKISSVCTNSTDNVQIIFGCPMPTTATAGPDQLNYDVTSTILQGNTPNYGIGQWSIISGEGGAIANPESPTSVFTGQIGENYELLWTISNVCGYSNDDLFIGFSTCGLSFKDNRDGQVYSTIKIGTHCWIAQNLNIGTRISGSSSNNGTIEKYCYDNSETNCDVYGGLYQWNEMMNYSTTAGVRGICPTGWRLPTDNEWTILTTYVSSQSVYRCNNNPSYIAQSFAATTNWNTSTITCAVGNNLAANNATGFTALPTGIRYSNGLFVSLGIDTYFWSSTGVGSSDALTRYLYDNYNDVRRGYYDKSYGFSVRCLKD